MTTSFKLAAFWHPAMLDHKPPDGAYKFAAPEFLGVKEPHPERPERIKNIKKLIESVFSEQAQIIRSDPASKKELSLVHNDEYIDRIESFSEGGGGRIENTTTGGNTDTFRAARHATGAAIQAAKVGASTELSTIPYAVVRPPGHHAQSDKPDGFCFFNHTSIAAEKLITDNQVESVAIVDWDIHHGNGTQEIFYDRADVLPISIHTDHGSWDSNYHPQEGSLEENGVSDGKGYTVNIPVPPAVGEDGYMRVLNEIVEPILSCYQPDIIIVSAGQDAGIADPNGRNMLNRSGFRHIAKKVRSYANFYANGNIALVQEGGYQLSHLSFATLGVLEGLLNVEADLDEITNYDPFDWLEELRKPANNWIEQAKSYHSSNWPL